MAFSLQSDIIILRSLEPEDLSFLYQCENNTNNWKVSNTLTPYSKYILKQYIENSHLDIYSAKQLRLIIESKSIGKSIGAIDLFDFDPHHQRAGIGILIEKNEDRMKGFANSALHLLIEYCFTHLKMNQLYCNIGESNKASIKLFTKVGFVQMSEKKNWLKVENGWESELSFQLINNKIQNSKLK